MKNEFLDAHITPVKKKKIHFSLSKPSTALDELCTDYGNIILVGDFNIGVEEKIISEFMSVYNLRNFVTQKILF